MGTIENKLNNIINTKDKLKTITNLSTTDAITSETVFRDYPKKILKEYVKIINNGTNELYTNFPKIEDEGTELELNTEKGPMKITLKGNLNQNTTIGKNLFNQTNYAQIDTRANQSPSGTTKTVNSISFTSNASNNYSGIYITLANMQNYINNFDSNTTYYISADITTNVACIMYYGTTGNSEQLQVGTQRLVKNGKLSGAFVFYIKATEANIKIENIMVSTNSDINYEPYTGGIASPNPNYPQSIEAVTGNNFITVQNQDNTQQQTYPISLGGMELAKIGTYQDYIYGTPNNWYLTNYFTKIESYNGETITTEYLSTTGGLDIGATIYYYNGGNNPLQITDTTLIEQLNNLYNAKSYDNKTYISQTNDNLPFIINTSALLKDSD